MKTPRAILVGMLLALLAEKVNAQQSIPDCAEIKVESKVVDTPQGVSGGSIELTFDKPTSSYKILWINSEASDRRSQEVQSGRLANLKPGIYDFLIVDKSKTGCVKQLTVIIK